MRIELILIPASLRGDNCPSEDPSDATSELIKKERDIKLIR